MQPAGGKERRDADVTAHMNKNIGGTPQAVADNLNELVKLLGVNFGDFINDSAFSRQKLSTQVGKIDKSIIPEAKRDDIAGKIRSGSSADVAKALHELDELLGGNLG